MAEELQHLIERIRKEGVEKAETESSDIVTAAKAEAEKIVAAAKAEAAQMVAQAEQDADVFTVRSTRALEQAGRDLLLTVGKGVEAIFNALLNDVVVQSLNADVMANLIGKLAEEGVSVKVSEEVLNVLKTQFADKMKSGIDLGADQEILAGFKLVEKEGSAYRDFTDEAIVEALSAYLRPQLAEILKKAVA
jgi:V/A-type H+-transporting ATPase subunit E